MQHACKHGHRAILATDPSSLADDFVLAADQRDVVQEAFAGLDVVADFQEEISDDDEAAADAKKQPAVLAGWVRVVQCSRMYWWYSCS